MADVASTPTTPGDYQGGDLEAASELAANKAYADAVTQLNGQRLNTLQGAGYMGDIDPSTGAITNQRVDPNNPYGTYQTLLRNSAQEGEQIHNQSAARGIGGGLAQQGDKQAAYDYGAGANQLGTGLTQQMGGYDQQQVGAANSRSQNIITAKQQAAQAALQYQLQNTLLALPGNIARQLSGSPAGSGGQQPYDPATYTPPDVGTQGQGANYNPNPVLAKAVGGSYTQGGGATYYQSNRGPQGARPLY